MSSLIPGLGRTGLGGSVYDAGAASAVLELAKADAAAAAVVIPLRTERRSIRLLSSHMPLLRAFGMREEPGRSSRYVGATSELSAAGCCAGGSIGTADIGSKDVGPMNSNVVNALRVRALA